MRQPKSVQSASICGICALLLAAVVLGQTLEFRVPGGDLKGALDTYVRQSGVQLVYREDDIRGVRTEGVAGAWSAIDALARILAGTSLTTEQDASGAIAIVPAKSAAARASTAAPAKRANSVTKLTEGSELSPGTSLPSQEEARPEEAKAQAERIALEEIVVTGTFIRGETPVGTHLITIDREEIDRSGLATVPEMVRRLPQNFGGGVNEEFSSGREGDTNTTDGNSFNLRGLGSGATLVLLNGRRLASTGSEGLFTDVTNIPLSAVERIEVLLDGASALYGSDAVGGVVNIILRKDYAGAETRVRAGTVTEGNAQEYQVGQSLGAGWATGHGLLWYEFYEREALPRRTRALSADCNLERFGGDNFCTMFNNPGTILVGDETYAIPRGQDGTSLTPEDFVAGTVNLGNPNQSEDLLARQRRHSLSGFVSQSVGERWTLEGTALVSTREASGESGSASEFLLVTSNNPFYVNPAGGTDPIFIPYSFLADFGSTTRETDVETYSAALTAKLKATDTWLLTTDVGYSRDEHDRLVDGLENDELLALALADPDPATAFNPFGDGSHTNPQTLAMIRGRGSFSGTSDLWTAQAVADGPLLRLAGRDVRLAIGAEYRRQEFSGTGREVTGDLNETRYDRDLSAGFAELRLPLVDPVRRRPGLQRLDLSFAGRYESYSDFGDSTNPKLGVDWSPIAGVAIRASWGTSFKAPAVLDISEAENISFIIPIADPLAEFGFSDALVWIGGNPDLNEETATTWSAGVEISPPTNRNLRLSLSYFDIDFEDRIELVVDPSSALLDPALADIVTRNPTDEQREVVCSRSTFSFGAPEDCRTFPIAAIVDGRIGNSAVVRNRGLDFLGSYRVDSAVGALTFKMNATYLIEFARALRMTSPVLDILNTPLNPLELRLRGSLSWARGGLEATAYVNYVDGYRDTVSEPDRTIDSWTTLDLAVSYKLPFQDPALLSDTELALNVQNLFDEDPPFYNNPAGVGYDPVNATLLGRFVSLQLRKRW